MGTTREWRRMERRAVKGHERDLLAALDELSSGRPEVTGIDVDPGSGRTVTLGLGRQQLVLGPLSPSSAAVVSRVRRDAAVVGLDADGFGMGGLGGSYAGVSLVGGYVIAFVTATMGTHERVERLERLVRDCLDLRPSPR
jgi:hypothetical protein